MKLPVQKKGEMGLASWQDAGCGHVYWVGATLKHGVHPRYKKNKIFHWLS
jgi:hypothetical protein